jgi:hypothetical protein
MIKSLNLEISDIKLKLVETEKESKSSREELDRIMTSNQQTVEAQNDFKQQLEDLTLEKVIQFFKLFFLISSIFF